MKAVSKALQPSEFGAKSGKIGLKRAENLLTSY
jgi:hypothetical protein